MPVLSSHNHKILLEIARNAVRDFLATGNHEDYPAKDHELLAPRGCFVTLRENGKLRGCVGTFDDSKPLVQNVARMAISAATQDHRFHPVTKEELSKVDIEISVIGPLEKAETLDSIEIGKHGVMVQYKNRRGTFLPDVAVERKWSVPEFVMYCAREKADLHPEEISKAEIYRYEVEKFKD